MNKYIYILVIIPLISVADETIIYEEQVHTDSVDSLCIKDKAIISASFDRDIKKTVGNKSKVIGKHKDWVRKVICTDTNIITASNDGMISIWNDSKRIHSVRAHSWWVTDIDLYENKIISVSLDETVKVWSYPELKLLYTYKPFGSNKHYSVTINNGKAFIGSTNGYLFILDMNKIHLKKNIVDRTIILERKAVLLSSTKSLEHVFIGTSNGFIVKVERSNPYRIITKQISDFALKAIAYSNGFLYIGDDNGVLRKVNSDDFEEYYEINKYPEAIRTLISENNYIYAGFDKGYIRIFNSVADETKMK